MASIRQARQRSILRGEPGRPSWFTVTWRRTGEAGRYGTSVKGSSTFGSVDGFLCRNQLSVHAGIPEEEGRLGGFLQGVEGVRERIWKSERRVLAG